ncbi:hypothetical protein B0J13DRAFT_563207 [Dactylonectria estremocensis]|uniref:Prion-inhibition and propagation HeLo domain-containing protein n=1 Tax=Dactylonectria estremocensis TaxID=1079267 RepID=A0A9P9IRC8_9HYPO|nr:hypothetical protein B0J13DRAFT_563207 [Dactylonectria estremocensis]
MEPVGLAIGAAGLAGLFSSCLEAVDKVQSYKSFKTDSHVFDAQFRAKKLRFESADTVQDQRDIDESWTGGT